MTKNLLIVESPAKAKTIEKYLGKDFTVKSSYGHIRDLDKGSDAIVIEDKIKLKYVVSPEKKKVVKELKDWVKKADEVWLATDEDREGEAISWHLCEVLGLQPSDTKRIVFREITKPAIQNAIKNPRHVDINLVNAQQARRVVDRLVGFELSETLWKKVRNKLSAGRVQSVAVKLLVEREREINSFVITNYFGLSAWFDVQDKGGLATLLRAEYAGQFDTQEHVQRFLEKCKEAQFTIGALEKKPSRRKPSPPFITSTLQQEASRKLGFAVKRTMQVAQRLYEKGLITYMRTDSVQISSIAQAAIAQHIEKNYGKRYLHTRQFTSKNASAQEAHEAIRPTYLDQSTIEGERDEKRLYELIWKRAIASQMSDAELERTIVTIDISNLPDEKLKAEGEVLLFDGFLKLYNVSQEDDDENESGDTILPPLKVGQRLPLNRMEAREKFTKPPARYSEAGLVKKLEELGIGRPSTYAPTITKIMEEGRGYVVKANRDGEERSYVTLVLSDGIITVGSDSERFGVVKNRLIPTDMGMIVTDFLEANFPTVMDYNFTAEIEEDFDSIAEGDVLWDKTVKEIYTPFHEQIVKTIEESERATGERILGQHPQDGRTILVRMARYGPVVQWGTTEEVDADKGESVQYGNLLPGQSIESITFEEALAAFSLPKNLGTFEGHDVTVNSGRYGPYIKYQDSFINLGRGTNPLEVTLDQAIEKIREKQEADKPVMTYKGQAVTKGKGRFGPFLKVGDLYVNIPARINHEEITQDEMTDLIEKKIEKEANRYIQRWEDEKIAVENGRWGPFIRFNKKSVKLPKGKDGKKMTPEEAAELTLEQVKSYIEAEVPGAFAKKTKKK